MHPATPRTSPRKLMLLGLLYALACSGCGSSKGGSAPQVGNLTLQGTLTPAGSGSGAHVHLSGAATQVAVADASGNYSFLGLGNGDYTVTPSKTGIAFSPPNQAVTISGASASGIDFVGAPFTPNLTVDGAQQFQTMGGM